MTDFAHQFEARIEARRRAKVGEVLERRLPDLLAQRETMVGILPPHLVAETDALLAQLARLAEPSAWTG